jgi:hypothetical protein
MGIEDMTLCAALEFVKKADLELYTSLGQGIEEYIKHDFVSNNLKYVITKLQIDYPAVVHQPIMRVYDLIVKG